MGQEPPHASGRGQLTCYGSYPKTELVGIRRRFMGIKEHRAVKCPCCDATIRTPDTHVSVPEPAGR